LAELRRHAGKPGESAPALSEAPVGAGLTAAALAGFSKRSAVAAAKISRVRAGNPLHPCV